MSNRPEVHNRQRRHWIDCRFMETIVQALLADLQKEVSQLDINIVDAAQMSRLNETFLRHQGSTDVLAFDYRDPSHGNSLFGELFLCADEARIQAGRFNTSWQSELVRYAVHGILHLLGYDDHNPDRRRKMKRLEDRLLKRLASRFEFPKLGARPGRGRKLPTRRILRIKKYKQKLATKSSR